MSAIIWVGLGGALGSVLRYLSGLLVSQHVSAYGSTLLVNLLGSLLIGIAAAYFATRAENPLLRLALITGILGGFTTLSAFSIELSQLLFSDRFLKVGVYLLVNLVGGRLASG